MGSFDILKTRTALSVATEICNGLKDGSVFLNDDIAKEHGYEIVDFNHKVEVYDLVHILRYISIFAYSVLIIYLAYYRNIMYESSSVVGNYVRYPFNIALGAIISVLVALMISSVGDLFFSYSYRGRMLIKNSEQSGSGVKEH
jgi:hypothetical protein